MKLSLPLKQSFPALILVLALAITLLVMLQTSYRASEITPARPMSVTPTDEPMLAPKPLIRNAD